MDLVNDRLGAEIMVVTYQTTSHTDLDEITLRGAQSRYYLSAEQVEKTVSREGVGQATSQFYLAEVNSSLTDGKMHIVGIDPETDFVISPWIDEGSRDTLQTDELIVGANINVDPGVKVKIYGREYKVVAKLAVLGDYCDDAIFGSFETIQNLMDSADDDFGTASPLTSRSSVLINSDEETAEENLLNDINLHVRGVVALQEMSMMQSISRGASNVSGIIGMASAAAVVLILIIAVAVFVTTVTGQAQEMAVLRILGQSSAAVKKSVKTEVLLSAVPGALAGSVLGIILMFPVTAIIKSAAGLPLSVLSFSRVVIVFILSILLTCLVSYITGGATAAVICRKDPSQMLREEDGA